MLNSGHCGDHTNDRPDAQLRGEEHPGLQRGGGHQPGGGRAERDGVWSHSPSSNPICLSPSYSSHLSSSCVSRVDSQRAKSPIPGVVEDKQFAGQTTLFWGFSVFYVPNVIFPNYFTQMRWSGIKLTRSLETEGSESMGPEHSSTRQVCSFILNEECLWE